MPKPFHEEIYTHNGIKALIKIIKEKSIYHGSWACKACGESNNSMGVSSSFDATLINSKGGFEKHVSLSHL